MNDRENLRNEIEDADDTGLVAGEQLITQAETMLPLLQQGAVLPHEDLHAALPEGHDAHATIDKLQAEVEAPSPNPSAIEEHVGALRAFPELEAIVVNWWENPRVQRVIADLGQIGL
ncbi:MAG TPA: hypothetical protein VFE16_01580 [Candidatus Cybelea sp.]|jgi:hypothetical protein|nr:hypothetical protein [Candidatus Cybelea sp.]